MISTMRYIIYCRKSTDTEDKQVLSLDSQERELSEIGKKNNLSIVRVFKESMSAKAVGRPLFDQMMEMIATGRADAILCWKLDRLARNFIDGGLIIDSLQRSKIQEIRTHDAIHRPNDNVLLLAVQLGMANQYSRDLSVNVKRGNREKLARGEWPNHAPFGYLNNRVDKSIIIDHERAKYVKRIYDLYITGSYSLRDIAKVLYQEGLRTNSGKKILAGQIHRVLSNPFYTGLMLREGKLYTGKHEPLVPTSLYDQAQCILNDKTRPKSKGLFFPLRGFIKCGNCGCAFTSSLKKGHHYYYCTNGKGNCEEHKNYSRENSLYAAISEIFERLQFSEKTIDLMYQAAKERTGATQGYRESIQTSLYNRLESLIAKETKLLDTFLSEQISQELYTKTVLNLQNERLVINRQINELKSEDTVFTLEPIKEIFLQSNRAKNEFLKADDEKKRNILENLLWNLSIKNKSVASVKLKNVYEVMLNAPKNGDLTTLLRD